MRIDSAAAHNPTHDRIEGQPVGIVEVLVSGQSPADRLPEKPVWPMEGVLPRTVVAQRRRRQIGQSERVIQLRHHQQAAVRTDLRTPEFQPHPTVEIHPITPLRTRTLR